MPAPEGYIDVASRIAEFRSKHPEGSLRAADPAHPFHMVEVAGTTYVVFVAAAYRTPDDEAPGIGTAWEVVPGATNFTRGSELQNAETSAWGRAIIAVGAADSKQGVATAEDVQWRQAEAAQRAAEDEAVGGLRSSIIAAVDKLDDDAKAALKDWMRENDLPAVRRMNAGQCDRVLDWLMSLPEPAPSGSVGETP